MRGVKSRREIHFVIKWQRTARDKTGRQAVAENRGGEEGEEESEREAQSLTPLRAFPSQTRTRSRFRFRSIPLSIPQVMAKKNRGGKVQMARDKRKKRRT